jgi:hypothetical protein
MAENALAKKLQLKPGRSVLVLDAPPGFVDELKPLPDGVKLAHRASGTYDVVHLFVKTKADFEARAKAALKASARGGMVWVAWPKGSAKMATDLNRDTLAAAAEAHGLRPVANVSIDETWSALRFKRVADA